MKSLKKNFDCCSGIGWTGRRNLTSMEAIMELDMGTIGRMRGKKDACEVVFESATITAFTCGFDEKEISFSGQAIKCEQFFFGEQDDWPDEPGIGLSEIIDHDLDQMLRESLEEV
ncbi:TPA: hypothetical protein HA278_01160 [Candidatus Woesearchaeota archaeon]|nr:hypothetical protein [Candidatus Woesearchaeota archaeon]|tara:strand:- start:121 stop:465 length:345 start_codon:yes stop_codon:yes gene_type:complete